MPSTLPILRARRERRLAKQRTSSDRTRGVLLSVGMLLSLALAALIILGAFAYADVTRELPSVEVLPLHPDKTIICSCNIYKPQKTICLFYPFVA